MNIREIPKVKLAVLGFYAASMLFMSACAYSAAAEAKEAASPAAARAEVTAAVMTPEKEENKIKDAAPTETEPEDTAEVEEAISYDSSAQHPAAVLSDGDAIVGGAYTAEGEDESALGASGNVTATVTGALLQKLGGNASSADGDSWISSLDGDWSDLDLNGYTLYINGVVYAG